MAEIIKERGYFWWFNEPSRSANSKSNSVPGLLTISNDGQIALETDSALCLVDEYRDWSKPRCFPKSKRVAGYLAASGKYVLIEGLERTDLSFSDETPQRQEFAAETCAHRDSPFPEAYGEGQFTALRIELAGFEEWLELDSMMVDREYPDGDDNQVHVSYKEWNLRYPVREGTLAVESITTGVPLFFRPDLPQRDVQLEQHFYLTFTPDSLTGSSDLRLTYTSLEELIALFLGTYRRLPWPILVTKEEFEEWNTLYFYRGGQSSEAINKFSIWVTFKQIRENFGDLFKRWLAGSESFGAGYYLYVSSLRNPHHYSEHRFVNLVWAVEALHRKWLPHSEESDHVVRERNRVERILTLPMENEDRKWLGKKLAHAHEPSLEARILECLRKLPFSFGKGEIERFAKTCAEGGTIYLTLEARAMVWITTRSISRFRGSRKRSITYFMPSFSFRSESARRPSTRS